MRLAVAWKWGSDVYPGAQVTEKGSKDQQAFTAKPEVAGGKTRQTGGPERKGAKEGRAACSHMWPQLVKLRRREQTGTTASISMPQDPQRRTVEAGHLTAQNSFGERPGMSFSLWSGCQFPNRCFRGSLTGAPVWVYSTGLLG